MIISWQDALTEFQENTGTSGVIYQSAGCTELPKNLFKGDQWLRYKLNIYKLLSLHLTLT